MIELEPVPAEEEADRRATIHQPGDLETHGLVDVMEDMTRFDAERLHELIASGTRATPTRAAPARSSTIGTSTCPSSAR